MKEKDNVESPAGVKTSGIGSFGGEDSEEGAGALFRVAAGHSADYALMQSAQMMACVHKLTHQVGMGQDPDMGWAAHYISGMAKALLEDVAHSMWTEG